MSEGSSTDPNKLVGESGSDTLKHRDFFWDSIILYSVSTILALAGVDAVTEFIRGSSVVCRSGSDGDYINNYCSGSLPATEYIPAIIFIHGLVIAIPHYIWVATYAGQFDYFFSVVKGLNRSKDEKTKLFNEESISCVRELHLAFTTYGRNSMLWLYRLKLVFQLVVAFGFFVAVIIYFTEFDVLFLCPRNNATDDPFWPLGDQRVECVFTSMRLLWWVRILYLILVCFIVIAIVWGSLWSISGHPEELGAESVARFSFQSGIPPCFYRSSFYTSGCCHRLNGTILTRIPLPFKKPLIKSDLDFLLLKLFRTDAGLGRVFRAMLIEMAMIALIENDQKILALHFRKQTEGIDLELSDSDQDTKWKFNEEAYQDFDEIPANKHIEIPDFVRGALLGLGRFAPDNDHALCITFGTCGLNLGLARVFGNVGSIELMEFDRKIANIKDADSESGAGADNNQPAQDKLRDVKKFTTLKDFLGQVFTVTAPENILTADIQLNADFRKRISPIWRSELSSLIVIGPINTYTQGLSVSVFLQDIKSKFQENCLLLSLRPVKIAGRCTESDFYDWNPPKQFKAVPLRANPVNKVCVWPITKYIPAAGSTSDPQVQQPPAAEPLEEFEKLAKDEEEIHHSRPRDVERAEGVTERDTAPLTKEKADSEKPQKPTLALFCGEILCQFEVGLYEYN